MELNPAFQLQALTFHTAPYSAKLQYILTHAISSEITTEITEMFKFFLTYMNFESKV